MTVHAQQVIRWPFALTGSNNTVRFKDTGGASTNDQVIAADTYLTKGETGTANPADFVNVFRAAIQAAYVVIHGGLATFTVRISLLGRIEIFHNGGPSDDIDILWDPASSGGVTTLDASLLGFIQTIDVTVSGSLTTSPHQIKYAWYPGIDHKRDSAERDRVLFNEVRTLNGRPYQTRISVGNYFERDLAFDFVMSARVVQARTDDALFAAVAGLTAGDPNAAIVNLKDYLLTATGFPQPGRVYTYTTSDPTTHVQQGSYHVLMSKFWKDLGGVDDTFLMSGLSQERYEVPLLLWKG